MKHALRTVVVITGLFLVPHQMTARAEDTESELKARFDELLSDRFPATVTKAEASTIAECSSSMLEQELEIKRLRESRREAALHHAYGGRIWILMGTPYAYDARRQFLSELIAKRAIGPVDGANDEYLLHMLVPALSEKAKQYWPLLYRLDDELLIYCRERKGVVFRLYSK